MHGYHPSEPTADAVLLATRPVDRSVEHITDVHDVILDDTLEAASTAPHGPHRPSLENGAGDARARTATTA
jgi:hypothetical protein